MLEKATAAVPRLIYLDEVDSTNLELSRIDRSNLPELTAVVAASQSAGKGRLNRSWVSEPGASAAVSLLLRPGLNPAHLPWMSLMAAVSVRATIAHFLDKPVSIKWPNDVLVHGKKISGILARLEQQDLILGVGINIRAQASAPDHATSLEELGGMSSLDETVAEFLSQFRARYNRFKLDPSWSIELTANEFRQHCSTIGERVRAIYPDGSELVGLARDVDELGNLLVEGDQLTSISAADIVHLRN